MRRLTALPLPEAAYVPGRTPRTETGIAFEVARRAPAVTEADRWQSNEAWLYGIDLFGAGFFWEAHEVLEPVWINARPNSRERAAVRGVIQLANACLKLEMGRRGAALRLLRLATTDLRDAGDEPAMGLHVADLADAVERFRQSLEAGDARADAKPPMLAPFLE